MNGGAPSLLHEERKGELATMLHLAGLVHPVQLQWWLRPDVCLAAPPARLLGIGDAKATEQPGDAATLRRLIAYVRASRSWYLAGWDVLMGLAVAPADRHRWLDELHRAWAIGGLRAGHQSAWSIHPRLALVTLSTDRAAPRRMSVGAIR